MTLLPRIAQRLPKVSPARLALVVSLVGIGGCLRAAPMQDLRDGGNSGGDLSGDLSGGTIPTDGGPIPFQADPPEVYVAKVKNILIGLAPTDDEVNGVRAGTTTLATLVDQWMQLPTPSGSSYPTYYEQKMSKFFQLAFQQTQISAADFVNTIPPNGLGPNAGSNTLVQNVSESFGRTMVYLARTNQPFTNAFNTRQVMMTTALKEFYAYLDVIHADDNGHVVDAFANANSGVTSMYLTSKSAIPMSQTLDPSSANYLHWSITPDLVTLLKPRYTGSGPASCIVDPTLLPVSAYSVEELMLGGVADHFVSAGKCGQRSLSAAAMQLAASDFQDWQMVTVRAPMSGETTTRFFDLPTLRTVSGATPLIVNTPHEGFFSTPAFQANWPTNASNQMRVTTNQALIVATGSQYDAADPATETQLVASLPTGAPIPGLNDAHSSANPACYSCHVLLDPTRSIMSSTYSWFFDTQTDATLTAVPGIFAFGGVVKPMHDIDDFATMLSTHPRMPTAWVQKLCYYVNSAPCAASDLATLAAGFVSSGYNWTQLVKAVVTSAVTTNANLTDTAKLNLGQVIAVSRRDHICAALDNRLGLTDICGLDVTTNTGASTVPNIVTGLPSDGYGRGSIVPVLPNQPTSFYWAGMENVCEAVSAFVVDPTAASKAAQPNVTPWSSADATTAIAAFAGIMMGITANDPRRADAVSALTDHFTSAKATSGITATDALRSTFVAACLAASSIGVGM